MAITINHISSRNLAYRAFIAACEGGGTPPDWTQCGEDPASWDSPVDAAGTLILRQEVTVEQMEPIDPYTTWFGSAWVVQPSHHDVDRIMDTVDRMIEEADMVPPISWQASRIEPWGEVITKHEKVYDRVTHPAPLPVFPGTDAETDRSSVLVSVRAVYQSCGNRTIVLLFREGVGFEQQFILVHRAGTEAYEGVTEKNIRRVDPESTTDLIQDVGWGPGILHPMYEWNIDFAVRSMTAENAASKIVEFLQWAARIDGRRMGRHLGFTMSKVVDSFVRRLQDSGKNEFCRPFIDRVWEFKTANGREPSFEELTQF